MVGQLLISGAYPSGDDQHSYEGALVRDAPRQLEPVDRPWHIHVRYDNADVWTGLKEGQGFLAIHRLDDTVIGLIEDIRVEHADEGLIFDKKENGMRLGHAHKRNGQYLRS
jgi:hypothetical protein